MRTTKSSEQGFTLVELMLAMAFLAFLLLFTVNVTMQLTLLYSKGVSTRQINQTGRQVVDAVGRSLRYTTPRTPGTQRLCLNGTTYAWNTDVNPDANRFNNPLRTRVGFVSIADPSEAYCLAGDIPTTGTTDLIGPNLTVIDFTVTQRGNLWDVKLLLSTAGDNKAVDVGAGKYECAPDNKFCAFAEFNTSIYNRRL